MAKSYKEELSELNLMQVEENIERILFFIVGTRPSLFHIMDPNKIRRSADSYQTGAPAHVAVKDSRPTDDDRDDSGGVDWKADKCYIAMA